MLSFSLTNLPLSMYVVDDLPRRYFASRQIPLPLIFTGNGACRPRPRRKPEMNFCSTVICSLFRLPARLFAPQSVCKGHSRPPHPTVKPSAERRAVSVVSAMLMITLQRFLLSWVIMVLDGLEGSCHAACG